MGAKLPGNEAELSEELAKTVLADSLAEVLDVQVHTLQVGCEQAEMWQKEQEI